jgi:uncharacterized protein
MIQTMTLDLTVTKTCNFACSYCFELGKHQKKHMSIETFDKIIDFMKRHHYNYNLFLMGGEPTLAPNLPYFLKRVKEEVQKDHISLIPIELDGMSVLLTNGYSYNQILKSISSDLNEEDIEFWKKYLRIQVSYDGKVIQDKYRKTKSGKLTSGKVLKTLDELMKNNFFTFTKSTLNIYDFPLLSEVIEEFKELNLKYKRVDYSVTENKDSFNFVNIDEIKNYIDTYFPDIIKKEYKFYKEHGRFITRWLNDSSFDQPKTKCSAGVSMIHIDPQGEVHPCHLSLYVDHSINYGNILKNEKEVIQNLNKYRPYFLGVKEDKCKNCPALFCLRCPVDKYNMDQNLNELYNGINDKVCFYYQTISKYIYYLKSKLNLLKG